MRACPNCNDAKNLRTWENVIGYSYVHVANDEKIIVQDNDYSWTGPVQGVLCMSCDWEYEGTDWLTQLVEKPVPINM